MPYPIKDIPDIDDGVVAMLKTQGIRSTASLLEKACTLKQRRVLAEKTGLDARKLLCWANGADRMRVKGVSREYAELQTRSGDGRGKQEAQTGAPLAVRERRHPMDRKREMPAAQDQVLSAQSVRCRP
jgi:hypothetical protein